MKRIDTYARVLKLRAIFKRVQQISWTSNKVEQRYDIDSLNDEDLEKLMGMYFEFGDELRDVCGGVEDERE